MKSRWTTAPLVSLDTAGRLDGKRLMARLASPNTTFS